MSFRISPRPPEGSGAYQQAVMLKRVLEEEGWAGSLRQRGPTTEHRMLLSAIWHIAYPRNGGVTKMSFDGHEIVFSCTHSHGMMIAVDDFQVSFNAEVLSIMLDCGEVTS